MQVGCELYVLRGCPKQLRRNNYFFAVLRVKKHAWAMGPFSSLDLQFSKGGHIGEVRGGRREKERKGEGVESVF